MSGGHFNYLDSQLKSEIFGWNSTKPTNIFKDKEISQLIWDVLDLIHEYDWYMSGDSDENDYTEAKIKFKNKWLASPEKRQKNLIDDAVEDLRKELYETFLLDNEGWDNK